MVAVGCFTPVMSPIKNAPVIVCLMKSSFLTCLKTNARNRYGAVAQLIRVLPWHGRSRGFESLQLHHNKYLVVTRYFLLSLKI